MVIGHIAGKVFILYSPQPDESLQIRGIQCIGQSENIGGEKSKGQTLWQGRNGPREAKDELEE